MAGKEAQEVHLVSARRLEPKKVFRCVECNPPPAKARVYRRYWFLLERKKGERGEYCLPCGARLLGRSQGDLRRTADSGAESQQ